MSALFPGDWTRAAAIDDNHTRGEGGGGEVGGVRGEGDSIWKGRGCSSYRLGVKISGSGTP